MKLRKALTGASRALSLQRKLDTSLGLTCSEFIQLTRAARSSSTQELYINTCSGRAACTHVTQQYGRRIRNDSDAHADMHVIVLLAPNNANLSYAVHVLGSKMQGL